MQKSIRACTARKTLQMTLGLFICAFGTHLTIQANIGLTSWTCFSMGISYHLPLSFGVTHSLISIVILAMDLLMKEKIGLGTIFDAVFSGLFVDFFAWTGLVLPCQGMLSGAAMMIAGMFVLAIGQFLYMSAGLSCGPRDSLLIGLGKRLRRLPIGAVDVVLQCSVLLVGWLLGGPVGMGTVLAMVGMGVVMQIVFTLLHFDPRNVRQQSVLETARDIIRGGKYE